MELITNRNWYDDKGGCGRWGGVVGVGFFNWLVRNGPFCSENLTIFAFCVVFSLCVVCFLQKNDQIALVCPRRARDCNHYMVIGQEPIGIETGSEDLWGA